MVGRTGVGTEQSDVPTITRPAGIHTQAGQSQPATAVGHPDHPGSRGADGSSTGPHPDLRGRPAAGAVCLPAGGGGAVDAVRQVHSLLNRGFTQVVDADLSGYFDSIPHAELMKCLARRIVDRAMLHLIKMWLEMPGEEHDDRGHKHRTTRNKDEGRGTPQGAPISPLLSHLHR